MRVISGDSFSYQTLVRCERALLGINTMQCLPSLSRSGQSALRVSLQYGFIGGLVAASILLGSLLSQVHAQAFWHSRDIQLEANQRASLGVTSARPTPLSSRSIVASGLVVSAPGYEWVVTSPLPATMVQKLADLGDRVDKGQALAVLLSPALGELRRQLEELAIEKMQARSIVDRDRALLAEGLIPPARLQLSETRLAVIEASERAKLAELASTGFEAAAAQGDNLAQGRVLAPMRGQLIEASLLPGQRVEAGSVLFRIADTAQLQLLLDISLDKASQVRVGDRFKVQSGRASGTIAGISRALHVGQQARLRGRLDNGIGLALGDLVMVEIQSRVSTADDQIQVVPATALSQYKDKSILFIETPGGYRAQAVEVLARLDGQIHIRGKFGDQDRVAVAGVAALRALLQKGE